MQLVYEYVNISASDHLENYCAKKLESLGTKFPFVIRATIYFKKENRTEDEKCHCSIQLSMPGPQIHASSLERNFEASINETIRDLEDQLSKRKDKMNTY
ncbi:ribosome-associated translation inhibitor RaiA [Flavobacteriaceae bacterium F08102]|nr:ribosome-associated translation inhibitor RaiA [Flavobacteriaceae bacterium F08102]